MNAQHTPEPWELSEDQEMVVNRETNTVVAAMSDHPCAPSFDEALANLVLCRAAPELLKACEAFVIAWEKSHQLEKTDVALKLAKQAIANAKGEECFQ